MRVWLAGSRTFGAEVFEMLYKQPYTQVVAVTAPEGDALWSAAGDRRIRLQPQRVDWPLVERVRADVIVSAQNYVHISEAAREAATYGAIGYHPSLLPRHRGRSAVEWTIEMGDPIAGGTVYQMDDGWDTGPIIAQDWCHVVPDWTASDLWRERLFGMGVKLLERTLDETNFRLDRWPLNEDAVWEQDERVATSEPPWSDDPSVRRHRDFNHRYWEGIRRARKVGL